MKTRLRTLLALSGTATLVLAGSACGSKSANEPSTPAPSASGAATAPATSNVSLSETGSTQLFPLFDQWGSTYHEKYPNVTITAQGTGSGTGTAQAISGVVDIGASNAYLPEDDMKEHQGLMNIALAISAQQINYNLPGVTGSLKLNGKVLAAMYSGKITTWNDAQIVDLNPGVNLPNTPVVPVHRSDGTTDTSLFTQYLSKQDPDGWGKSPGSATTVDFPAVPGALSENRNEGMVSRCSTTPGCVAYIDISFSDQTREKGLGEAQLANAAGNYVPPDAQSIQAAAAGSASQTPANQAVSLVDGPAPNGYPIANYEYAIVNGDQKDAATAQTLSAFLHWAVTDGNAASFLDKAHFQPLPESVQKLSIDQIAKISAR
ncbi:MAG TPA: phosphate ABC transporter substrate-binding protein PstS [Mycobacterium sp.]